MADTRPSDPLADTAAFLRERLDHGNACLMAGNARGAIVYYDSALASFAERRAEVALRPLYHALWNNKALAHEQLQDSAAARHAALAASSLMPEE